MKITRDEETKSTKEQAEAERSLAPATTTDGEIAFSNLVHDATGTPRLAPPATQTGDVRKVLEKHEYMYTILTCRCGFPARTREAWAEHLAPLLASAAPTPEPTDLCGFDLMPLAEEIVGWAATNPMDGIAVVHLCGILAERFNALAAQPGQKGERK